MRDLDGECVTGVGNTRGSVILVAAPGSLISVIFDVWNVTVFLLSGLYYNSYFPPQFGSQAFLLVISTFSTFL